MTSLPHAGDDAALSTRRCTLHAAAVALSDKPLLFHLISVPSVEPKTLSVRTDRFLEEPNRQRVLFRFWIVKKRESVNRLIGSVGTEPTESPPLMN